MSNFKTLNPSLNRIFVKLYQPYIRFPFLSAQTLALLVQDPNLLPQIHSHASWLVLLPSVIYQLVV
jgi:hypothetical protein